MKTFSFLGLLNGSISVPEDATIEKNPALAKLETAYKDFVEKLKVSSTIKCLTKS